MTTDRIVELLEIELECVKRGAVCNRNCAACNLVQKDTELIEMYHNVLKIIKEMRNKNGT